MLGLVGMITVLLKTSDRIGAGIKGVEKGLADVGIREKVRRNAVTVQAAAADVGVSPGRDPPCRSMRS